MTWIVGRDETGWAWLHAPSPVLGSSGPTRVDTSDPDPDYKPRPVGFTADLEPHDQQGETEPLEAVIARVPDHLATLTRCPACGNADGYHFRTCPTRGGPA